MADRSDELRTAAAECLALSRSTIDPQTRTALLLIAQKLYDMASDRPGDFEAVLQEFNKSANAPATSAAPADEAATTANRAAERRIGPAASPLRRRHVPAAFALVPGALDHRSNHCLSCRGICTPARRKPWRSGRPPNAIEIAF
jgi:hypothetical protein